MMETKTRVPSDVLAVKELISKLNGNDTGERRAVVRCLEIALPSMSPANFARFSTFFRREISHDVTSNQEAAYAQHLLQLYRNRYLTS